MKRRLLIFCLAAVLCVAAVVAYRYRAVIFLRGEGSELFVRYKDTPGVDATFIHDFRVNDTLTLDVTLLQATDSMGWEFLIANIRLNDDLKDVIDLWKQKKHVLIQSFPKGHMDQPPDSVFLNNDLLAIDWANQTVAIFHITCEDQSKAIIGYHLNILNNNKKQQS